MPDNSQPVLLNVDDYLPSLYARTRVLRQAGFNVREAKTGSEALRIIETEKPALVILDVNLPDISGLEICRRIKGDSSLAATLVLQTSASSITTSDRVRALNTGADTFLVEPLEPEELIATVRALLRLRKAEGQARSSERLWKTVFDAANDTMLLLDEDYIIRAANRMALQAYRYTETELVGKSLRLIRSPGAQDKILEQMEGALHGDGVVFETEHRKSDGSTFPVEVSTRPVWIEGRKHFVQAVRDISARKHAEEALERMYQAEQRAHTEAVAAVNMRDQFFRVASHELKTPLTSLLGYAEVLQNYSSRGAALDDRGQRAVIKIYEQSVRLDRMITSLLDVSRIETGHLALDLEPVDIGELACAVVEGARLSLRHHTLDVTTPSEPLIVQGDEMRLEQALQNLVQNAIKYSPRGGPIRVAVEKQDDRARISVSDVGIGMPAAALSKLFQRFYRAENAEKLHIAGMGLGLYVVKEIVELHGGTITVQSEEDKGSTFTISLPLA